MIAVVKPKYRGMKSIQPGSRTSLPAAVAGRLSPQDRELLEKIITEPAEFVDNPAFHDPKTRRQLLSTDIDELAAQLSVNVELLPLDLPDQPTKASSAFKPLTAEQEIQLFLCYNYARYRIYQLLRRHRSSRMTLTLARKLLHFKHRELKARVQIVQANIPLVLAMAKRTKLTGVDFTELISEGNMALLRSVDKFDCARGFKFSTYACRAILKSFSRVATKTSRYRGRFPVEFDPALEKGDQLDTKRQDLESECVSELRNILSANMAELNEIEQTVICQRFAIGDDGASALPKTLEQVGEIIGVTKERVRQIQNRALEKLRVALEEGVLAV